MSSDLYRHERLAAREVGRFTPLSAIPGVAHACTTKRGGLLPHDARAGEPVARDIAAELGLTDVAYLRQVHGAAVVQAEHGGFLGEADGLVTDRPGLGLLVRSADCVLLLAAATDASCVGVMHASWRGTAAGAAGALVAALHREFGVAPSSLVVCVGPSAGPDSYEVGEDVRDAMHEAWGAQADAWFLRPAPDKQHLDLWAANTSQLLRAGVPDRQVYTARVDTIRSTDRYPSHRAEGSAAGRFAAIVGLTKP
jgi:hypothetical protein